MNTEQAVQHIDSLPTPTKREPTVGEMLQLIIQQGISKDNVDAFEKIVQLYERQEDRNASKSASRALRELQAECKGVVANKPVPDRSGGVRYKYCPYEEIMDQVQPLLTKHGFSVRFSQRMDADRSTIICNLTHDSGHTFTNEFTVRVGSGPPQATATQADSSAGTVAQREALCDALNIVRRIDDDARNLGALIKPNVAEELQHRVKMTNSNEAAFLKFCGVTVQGQPTIEDYKKIHAAKYKFADDMLAKKEAGK